MKEKKADVFIRQSKNKVIQISYWGGKHTMSKRVLSPFIALVFCFSLLPPAAVAEKTETEPITVQEQQEPNDSAAMQEQQEPIALPAAARIMM